MCKPIKMCINKFLKRAFALYHIKKRAILTVEASIIVPLFMLATITLLSLMSVVYVNEKIDIAISEEAKKLSLMIFENKGYGVGEVEANIRNRLGNRFINSGLILNKENGFDFSDTDVSNEEIIKIDVKYTIIFPFDVFGVFMLPLNNCTVMHTWVGYNGGLSGRNLDEYVYLTDTGSVYHKNRECSHIRLKIIRVEYTELAALRNRNGARYKSCIQCKPKATDSKIYVTEDGDRFHNTLSCSGLKRTVRKIRLSQVGNMRACLRCGY